MCKTFKVNNFACETVEPVTLDTKGCVAGFYNILGMEK
jgi:hypothetical protein